uniref:Zinc finger protein n=1 Tax=Caenorhabditis tropicalis TaxID=1561998 RepID=A0A1I7UDT6_9PELO
MASMTCPHCPFTSSSDIRMNRHKMAHEKSTKMYQCETCNIQFTAKSNLHRHRTQHSNVKSHECQHCGKAFYRKDMLAEHMIVHIRHKTGYECPSCDYYCEKYNEIQTHLRTHEVSRIKKGMCKKCNSKFVRPQTLLLHYLTVHDDSEPAAKRVKEEEPDLSTISEEPIEESSMLNMLLALTESAASSGSSPKSEDSENDLVMSFLKTLQDESTESSASPEPMESTGHNYECEPCGIQFNDENLYQIHKMIHSDEDPWKCQKCGVKFENKYIFHVHFYTGCNNLLF